MPTLALAAMLISAMAGPAGAQMFTDQPPPVPPAAVPDPGGAISLAPPSGPGSGPNLATPTLTQPSIVQPSIAAVPPVAASPVAPASNQAVLSLTARYGKDLPVINNGLVWRIFTDRPDENGTFKLIREERGATPNIVLPPGGYVVHVSFGLVSAVRPVTLKSETDRESFLLPAGGLRLEGRVGATKIAQNQISFAASLKSASAPRWCRTSPPATSRCCRRAPTTSSPTTATLTPWCARIFAFRPAS